MTSTSNSAIDPEHQLFKEVLRLALSSALSIQASRLALALDSIALALAPRQAPAKAAQPSAPRPLKRSKELCESRKRLRVARSETGVSSKAGTTALIARAVSARVKKRIVKILETEVNDQQMRTRSIDPWNKWMTNYAASQLVRNERLERCKAKQHCWYPGKETWTIYKPRWGYIN
jgi:hypothetical protein